MRREKPKTIYQSQQGVVSIIVVSILTITLALMAIGFSKLSDRELRLASNRESDAQAYYAARSGINDAIAYIRDGGTGFTGCMAPNTPPAGSSVNPLNYFTTNLSSGSSIAKYSCISVDSAPQVLSNTVTPGQPWIVKIDADQLRQLYIGWENSSYNITAGNPLAWLSTTPATFGNLPQDSTYVSNPNTTGVLRTQIYKVPRTDSNDTNSALAVGSRAYYLYPNQKSGAFNCSHPKHGCVDYGNGGYVSGSPSGDNGIFVAGQCSNPRLDPSGNNLGSETYCNSEIAGLNGDKTPLPTGNYYYLYFTAQYAPLRVVIQGTDSHGIGHPVQFTNAQAVIDVTGQGADQIQRVRARIGLTAQFNEPNYALQSMETLCKAFVLDILAGQKYQIHDGPNTASDSSDCHVPTAVNNIQGGGAGGH